MSEENPNRSPKALARCVHEVVDHIDAEGWDQPPKLYALVPTELLAAAEPGLLDQLEDGAEYTPIEQEPLPDDIIGGSRALEEFLATTNWPESVEVASSFRKSWFCRPPRNPISTMPSSRS